MRQRILLAIFLGGAAGGLARAVLERQWPADGRSWPWVTFAVNVAGTAILAAVVARLGEGRLGRPLIGVGFCGALTTFSALQLEALELAHRHHVLLALAYAAGSIGAGLATAYGVGVLARRTATA
ncbi:MAG TPA: CrcB family protein [Gaiellales bacterium]